MITCAIWACQAMIVRAELPVRMHAGHTFGIHAVQVKKGRPPGRGLQPHLHTLGSGAVTVFNKKNVEEL